MKKTISLVLVLALGLVAEVANADFTFGEPTPVPNVNSSSGEGWPDISADGLELYFNSDRPGCHGGLLGDIYVSTRPTMEDEWGEPVNLGSTVNSRFNDAAPSISADGLTLYFSGWGFNNFRPGGLGDCDVWMTTRAARETPWGEPVNLGSKINTPYHDLCPCISIDGLSLYFASFRPGSLGGGDLYVAKRASTEDDWGTPVWLGPTVNSSSVDGLPAISTDGLTLFFYRGPAPYHICMTSRATTDGDWDTPVKLGPPISDTYTIGSPAISADGRTLYFHSERPSGPGGFDIWQAPILPVVDLNGDGIVNGADLSIIADYWGTDEPLCDIGPMPWGDGIVDVQDLIVLAEYLSPVEPEEVDVDEDDAGSQVELEQGQILVVTLESNPTTGYSWEVVETQESILQQMGEAEFKQSQTGGPPLVGAGGWEIFRFKAISAGEMTLKLVYHRPWEEGVEPVKTFTLDVIVH